MTERGTRQPAQSHFQVPVRLYVVGMALVDDNDLVGQPQMAQHDVFL